jgi:hypothetical protein
LKISRIMVSGSPGLYPSYRRPNRTACNWVR